MTTIFRTTPFSFELKEVKLKGKFNLNRVKLNLKHVKLNLEQVNINIKTNEIQFKLHSCVKSQYVLKANSYIGLGAE